MTEVVVLGAGAAGLCAALAAADAGARVTLLERSEFVGGTMAQSAGVVWVPANHRAAEAGYRDSRGDALRYLESLSNGRIDPDLAARYVDTAPGVLRWLEELTGLRFAVLPYPDYHSEHPGAAGDGGRYRPTSSGSGGPATSGRGGRRWSAGCSGPCWSAASNR